MKFFNLLSILFFVCVTSCSNNTEKKPSDLLTEDRAWLTQFFKDILLYDAGIYTLCGSKPMTLIPLFKFDEEEYKKYIQGLTEKDKKELYIIDQYNLPETWEKWKNIRENFAIKKFILCEITLENPKQTFIYFIDILKTAAIIQEHYEEFFRVIQEDFHPLEVVLEINENKNSKFWNKIKGNPHLWGILLGYGRLNSYAFQWKYFNHSNSCQKFCKEMPFRLSRKKPAKLVTYSIENFELPPFASFAYPDEIIEKYEIERSKIQNLYKNKDFLDFTLELLQS